MANPADRAELSSPALVPRERSPPLLLVSPARVSAITDESGVERSPLSPAARRLVACMRATKSDTVSISRVVSASREPLRSRAEMKLMLPMVASAELWELPRRGMRMEGVGGGPSSAASGDSGTCRASSGCIALLLPSLCQGAKARSARGTGLVLP